MVEDGPRGRPGAPPGHRVNGGHPLRVVYLEHGSLVSGGQRSLLELVRHLPAEFTPTVACPEGPLAERARALGVAHVEVPGTEGSFRLHPVHTGRFALNLVQQALAYRKLAKSADIVHANSTRAGLACLLAFGPRRRGRHPHVIVHIRDFLPSSVSGNLVRAGLTAVSDRVVAISESTAKNFGKPATVVYNPVARSPREEVIDPSDSTLAIVGQITPWKDQALGVRVLAELRRAGVEARLLIVGEAKFVSPSTRFDNKRYESDLRDLAASLGVTNHVDFLGEREDIDAIMRRAAIVLVPSWKEPFGRTVVEAMAAGATVVATSNGGPAEVITDGVNGRLLPPRDVNRWTQVCLELLSAPDARRTLGAAAQMRARDFDPERHVARIVSLYNEFMA